MRLGVLAWRIALAVGIAYLVGNALWFLLARFNEISGALS